MVHHSCWLTSITEEPPRGIFGVPLDVSIEYANVALSLISDEGDSLITGYVPIIVAKCGVFLKAKGLYRSAALSIFLITADSLY